MDYPKIASVLLLIFLSACAGKEPETPPMPPIGDPPSFLLFFGWDEVKPMNQRGLATVTIKSFSDYAKPRVANGARIIVTGHTDKSGSDTYNMALSLRRANAVKAMLESEGFPPSSITTIGRGETQPLVSTPDGAREPQNRRVEIYMP